MAEPAAIPTLIFLISVPGLLYAGLRRDDAEIPLFLAVLGSYVLFGIGVTEDNAKFLWVGSVAVFVATAATCLQILLKRGGRRSD